jgi:hypothetical protein
MKVTIQKDKEPEREAKLFAIGTCLGLEIDKSMIRIVLTPSQWKVLAQSAADRSAK